MHCYLVCHNSHIWHKNPWTGKPSRLVTARGRTRIRAKNSRAARAFVGEGRRDYPTHEVTIAIESIVREY